VKTGAVPVEAGWRVYSSGAGILVRLIVERLLGLCARRSELLIDPVLPRALDGLCARWALSGTPLELHWRVGTRGHAPQALWLDDAPLPFARMAHPYREGGARVAMDVLAERLRRGARTLRIELG
jgi:cellobiose phosphorylase